MKPEELAREDIDEALRLAGWEVQDRARVNIDAGRGVAVREFPLKKGHGFADYLLYVDGQAVGVVGAKKQGTPLTGVEVQATRYSEGLPEELPAPLRPLPFLYQSTGVETRFTNRLDVEARCRSCASRCPWPTTPPSRRSSSTSSSSTSATAPSTSTANPHEPSHVGCCNRPRAQQCQILHPSPEGVLMRHPFNFLISVARGGLPIRRRLLFLAMTLLGCSSSRAIDPDIVRPAPGAPPLEKLPGPMLGPFSSYSDALLAACRKILTKPHATAGRPDQQDFPTRWRVATEYCAWVYYTPDQQYVISKLTDQSRVDPTLQTKTCILPPEVDDQRHPPGSIKYIYALHNHPYDDTLSTDDIRYIATQAQRHGNKAETKDGTLRLATVAFFSNNPIEPTCDGFHIYIPDTNQVLKWTRTEDGWECKQTGRVEVNDDGSIITIARVEAPCFR